MLAIGRTTKRASGAHGPGIDIALAVLTSLVASSGCGFGSDESANRSADTTFGGQPSSAGAGAFDSAPTSGTNLSFGGAQDMGFFRSQLEAGAVPSPNSLDAAGFFAEHFIELPPASCGQRVCLQPMVAVMGNLMTGSNCTMLHLGLNTPLAADPGARPPLSLAVVVDVSGSMAGAKLEFVQEGLSLLIDGMHDTDELALIKYADEAEVVVAMAPVGDNRVALRRAVAALVPEGSTNLSDGLVAGYEQIQQHYDSQRQNRVFLLSDGQPTAGNTSLEAIMALSRAYNSDGIGLTTVGLGSDFNVELMRGLAEQADGNFYFLEDAGAVDEVFTEELSFFVVPVALDVKLELEAGAAYEFGRALGAPRWENSGEGGSLEIPSVFIAHRESDQDVTDEDGRRGGGSSLLVELMPRPDAAHKEGAAIATVQVTYRDPTDGEKHRDEVTLRYPHAPDVLLEKGYFESENQASVQKSFVMLNIFVGMENAVMAFHTNEADAAAMGALENLIAAVEDYNDEIDDKDIELDLEMLRMLRQNMAPRAAVVESRPPRDPWPAD